MKKVNTCLEVFYLLQCVEMQCSAHIHKYGTILLLVFTLPDADVGCPLHVNAFNLFLPPAIFSWAYVDLY